MKQIKNARSNLGMETLRDTCLFDQLIDDKHCHTCHTL